LENETEKVVQRLCNFARPLIDFFSLLRHVHLRHFSFILNHKAVKCLHIFEIQNTAIVVAIDEIAIYDYSSVRICQIANIHTFLFINGWHKAKQPYLMMGGGYRSTRTPPWDPHFMKLPRTRKITYFVLTLFSSIK
jgi:hypothetical protein